MPLEPSRVDLGAAPSDPAGQFGKRVAQPDTLETGRYLRYARLLRGPNPTKWHRRVARLRQQAEKRFRHDVVAREQWLRAALREAGLIQ